MSYKKKDKQREIDEFFAWREAQNNRHRYMTYGEYSAWCRGGDIISHPSNTNALRGGITIDFSAPPIIGRFEPPAR